MKFIKGMIMGTALMAGGLMIYNEMPNSSKRKIIRRGREIAKRIGML